MATTFTGSDTGRAGLEIKKTTGTPDVRGVTEIQLDTNLTLTDNGNGGVTINSSGGGAGAGTVTSVSTTLSGITINDPTADAEIVGTLGVSSGGTGAITLTDGGVLLGSGTGAITPLGQATDGQLIIGDTGGNPILASLTSTGATITITPGAGSINLEAAISVTPPGGLISNVQYNDAGAFAGNGDFTYDGAGLVRSARYVAGADITAGTSIQATNDIVTTNGDLRSLLGNVHVKKSLKGKSLILDGMITVDANLTPGTPITASSALAAAPVSVDEFSGFIITEGQPDALLPTLILDQPFWSSIPSGQHFFITLNSATNSGNTSPVDAAVAFQDVAGNPVALVPGIFGYALVLAGDTVTLCRASGIASGEAYEYIIKSSAGRSVSPLP